MHSSVRRKIHSKTASTACLFYGTFSFCTCDWLGRGSSSLSYLRKENNGAVDYIKRSNTKQFRGLAVNILVLFPVLRIRSIHLHNDWKYTCTTFAHEPILSTHLATIRFQFRISGIGDWGSSKNEFTVQTLQEECCLRIGIEEADKDEVRAEVWKMRNRRFGDKNGKGG